MSVTPQSLEVVDIDTKDLDNAKHVEITSQGITWTPEEEKALVKKIDTYMLPAIWFMYLLSYMDRTNIGNAKIVGMINDLSLTSSQYSIALLVFFVTYVFSRRPPACSSLTSSLLSYLPGIMIVWAR